MGNVFGEGGSEQQIDLQVITRVEEEAGKYKDWLPEITTNYSLGFPPIESVALVLLRTYAFVTEKFMS